MAVADRQFAPQPRKREGVIGIAQTNFGLSTNNRTSIKNTATISLW